MSSANLLSLIVVEEATYDLVPANSPDWKTPRFTSENISATPNVNQSEEIRADRMEADQFLVSTESGGPIDFEFSAVTFDDFLEGLMWDSWTTNVLKIGTEEHSYSIEKEYTDLTANHFLLFTGQRVGEMSLGFTYGEAVKGSFTFAGASVTPSSATEVGTGSVAAATTGRIMNAVTDLSAITIGGVAFTGCLRSVQLNVNNNLRPAECIGSDTPADQFPGTAKVSGSLEAYLTDTTVQWYTDNVLNQNAMGVKFTISDGTNSYEFDMGTCKINGDAPSAEGINTDVMIKVDFTALYDTTNASSLMITKT